MEDLVVHLWEECWKKTDHSDQILMELLFVLMPTVGIESQMFYIWNLQQVWDFPKQVSLQIIQLEMFELPMIPTFSFKDSLQNILNLERVIFGLLVKVMEDIMFLNLPNEFLMEIVKKNQPTINLKGFMAGNAWTYMPIDNIGAVFDWWSHALISDDTYVGIRKNCNFSDIGPLQEEDIVAVNSVPPMDVCNDFLQKATNEMGNINIYDIYVDVCLQSRVKALLNQMGKAGSKLHKAMAASFPPPPYRPCEDEFTQTYLNNPNVQRAIHASIPYQWEDCSPRVQYYYSDVEKSVIPLYQYFVSQTNLKILVYSGDVDAIVPYPGTRQWIAELKRPIVESWRPWIVNKQVGGYVTVYKGLTFVTVRNAGHMVPETQPVRAFEMFSRFLAGNPL